MFKENSNDLTLIVSTKSKKNVFYIRPAGDVGSLSSIAVDTQLDASYVGSDSNNRFQKVRSVQVGLLRQGSPYPDVVVSDENNIEIAVNAYDDAFRMGGFDAPVTIFSDCHNGNSGDFKVVDLDKDGCNDIVATCRDSWEAYWFRSRCRTDITADAYAQFRFRTAWFGADEWNEFAKVQVRGTEEGLYFERLRRPNPQLLVAGCGDRRPRRRRK